MIGWQHVDAIETRSPIDRRKRAEARKKRSVTESWKRRKKIFQRREIAWNFVGREMAVFLFEGAPSDPRRRVLRPSRPLPAIPRVVSQNSLVLTGHPCCLVRATCLAHLTASFLSLSMASSFLDSFPGDGLSHLP